MVTIKEIADAAGVSIGTVDRVLHDRGRVSPETARRVRQVVDDLGFTPNIFARNLSTTKEYLFGVLMPRLDQDGGYWQAPFHGIMRARRELAALKIAIRIFQFDRWDAGSFRAAAAELRTRNPDGLLLAPVISEAADEVLSWFSGIPVVCFDTEYGHPDIRLHIGQDSLKSGRLAAKLMHQLIPEGAAAAVVRPDTNNPHIAFRVKGLHESLGAFGHRAVHEAVRPHETGGTKYVETIRRVLESSPSPAGIVVADSTTYGAAEALESLARTDVALIGYDLIAESIPFLERETIRYLITQSPIEQGAQGIQHLMRMIVLDQQVTLPRILMPLNIITKENYEQFTSMEVAHDE